MGESIEVTKTMNVFIIRDESNPSSPRWGIEIDVTYGARKLH